LVCGGDVRELLLHSLKAAQPDELQRELGAAAAGGLRRDEDVQIGSRAVADVIDERDLGAQVVLVARAAVEEDAHGLRAIHRALFLWRRPSQGAHEHERSD
jgi:hypothetical protein